MVKRTGQRTYRTAFQFATAVAVALALSSATLVQAASISYGNFTPVAPGISYLDVVESSGVSAVPLYGAPVASGAGLSFPVLGTVNPFKAQGNAGGLGFTDGQLNFTILGLDGSGNNVAISSIALAESGVYEFTGTGTAASLVAVSASMNVKITEIDGVAVTPITLLGNASYSTNLVASPVGSQPWNLNVLIDVDSQLTSLGVPYTIGATRAEVVIDNTLSAISQLTSGSQITKNAFGISIVPTPEVIPEPSTLALGALALGGFGCLRGRQRA